MNKAPDQKEFLIGEIFTIKKGKRLTKSDQTSGDTLFIGASSGNHGETARIGQSPLFPKNTITVSYNGSVGEAFYQEEPYWASDDVNVLVLKNFELNKNIALYLCAVIRKAGKQFQYNQKWNLERMRSTPIVLPVTTDGNPDWEYMQEYIAKLEREHIAKLDVYFKVCDLGDCVLTEKDKKTLSDSLANQQYLTKQYLLKLIVELGEKDSF